MQQFEVQGVSRTGQSKKVLVTADNVKAARAKAREQGITPVSVKEISSTGKAIAPTSAAGAGEGGGFSFSFRGISSFEIANLTRQLATLIKAHVPVVESLTALIEQLDHPKLKAILFRVRQEVNEGKTLADAFSLYPKVFGKVYINMVRAGESSGRLDVVLMRLADLNETQVKLKSKVQGALAYPMVMVVVGFLVLGVILVKVVPQITGIFKDSKKALPLPTEILISLSAFAQEYAFTILIALLLLGLFIERYIATEAGRAKKDELTLKLPLIKDIMKNVCIARFSRTLGTLLSSSVPMLTSLQITRNVVDHAVFEVAIDATQENVSQGRALATALKQTGIFPPIVIHMIGTGEKSGELEQMLINVADNYELQVDNSLSTMTRLLEPIMIVFMAVLVGGIVMAVLLPIFEMNSFG